MKSKCCPKQWGKFFKAVCDHHRHSILEYLKKHERANASDIIKNSKLSQPTISHHLKILCDAEVIIADKKGKEVYYSLAKENIYHCCMGFSDWFHKK